MRYNRLALLGVIILWSLSPVFVVGFVGAFDSWRAAALTVCMSSISVMIALHFHGGGHLLQAWSLIRNGNADVWKLAGTGLFAYFLYPIFYFAGLRGDQPVSANIINYTWPLIFVIFQARIRKRRVSFMVWMGMICAFIGALVATGDITGFHEILGSLIGHDHIDPTVLFQSITKTPVKPLVCALLGALSYGVYSAYAPSIRPLDSDGKLLSAPARFVIMLSFAACLHLVLQLVLIAQDGVMPPMSSPAWLYLLAYTAFCFTTGHFLWLKVRSNEENHHVTSPTAPYTYCIFVVGTLLLSIQSGHGWLNRDLLAGIALVLSGIYIVGSAPGIAPSSSFFIALAIAMAFSSYLIAFPGVSPREQPFEEAHTYLALLESLTGVFAILAGFTLQRLQVRTIENHKSFCSVVEQIGRLRDLVRQSSAGCQAVSSCAAELCRYHVWRFQPDLYADTSEIVKPPSEDWKTASLELHQASVKVAIEDIPDPEERLEGRRILMAIRSKMHEWNAFDLDAISQYERVALRFLLAAAVAILVTQLPILGLSFVILRCLLLAAMFVIVVAIESYQRGGENTLQKALFAAEEIYANSATEILLEITAREKRRRSHDLWFRVLILTLIIIYVFR